MRLTSVWELTDSIWIPPVFLLLPFLCQCPSQDPTSSRSVDGKINGAVLCRVGGRDLRLKVAGRERRLGWGLLRAGIPAVAKQKGEGVIWRWGVKEADSMGLLDRHLLMNRSN